jgi:hypothetical protein
MSRLIRDTDLIDAIEEWRSALVCTPAQYADCVVNGTLETVEEVIIDKLPTAYNLEAVVKELEREIERDNEKERQYFIEGNERLGYCLNGKASALKLAIEIVRRGGRNDCV